ncbi:MAG TPA: hypothetical protein VLA88_05270 [Candidatus Saccharimonadales bacterium]|nr:hypothetical protein [Candidatus Saccharimonadales bacterium]
MALLLVVLVILLAVGVIVWLWRNPDGRKGLASVAGAARPDVDETTPGGGARASSISTAASSSGGPLPPRPRVGSVLEQVRRLCGTPNTTDAWLYVPDPRQQRLVGDGPSREYYMRVNPDPEVPGGYTVERLEAEGRKAGPLDVHVFFVAPGGQVSQGTSKVVGEPVGADLKFRIPPPKDSTGDVIRFPMTTDAGRAEITRLAAQLSRAQLRDDE